MTTPNESLPENFQELIKSMSTQQAIPLGEMDDLPFLAIKIPAEMVTRLETNAITCEMRPSIFNVDYEEKTVALAYVLIRLNGSDESVYLARYDLDDDKQFSDVWSLLEMTTYGLLIATDDVHDFQQFDARLDADFDPRNILSGAKERSTGQDVAILNEVDYAIRSQARSHQELWSLFENIAPFDKLWYARITLGVTRPEA